MRSIKHQPQNHNIYSQSFKMKTMRLFAVMLPMTVFARTGGGMGKAMMGGMMMGGTMKGKPKASKRKMGMGGMGMMSSQKGEKKPTPPPHPPPTPPPYPHSTPTPQPTPTLQPTPIQSCIPTTGPCFSAFVDLQNVVSSLARDDIVALCGIIVTGSAIVVEQSNVTLCCGYEEGAQECVLQSSGSDRNLVVTGDDFTLQDIVFLNGVGRGQGNAQFDGNACGGNVVVDGDGDHRIIGCEFYNGTCNGGGYGGNVFIKTSGSIRLQRSSFINGTGYGGGVAVWDAPVFTTDQCLFEGNSNAGVFSGNLDAALRNPGQNITFNNTSFINNEGDYGGGFLASGFGTMPSLAVLNCVFEGNKASQGAAGSAFPDLNELDLRLFNNSGNDNVASTDNCTGFSFYLGLEPTCFDLTEDYPPP
jgi:hypothetical protein